MTDISYKSHFQWFIETTGPGDAMCLVTLYFLELISQATSSSHFEEGEIKASRRS